MKITRAAAASSGMDTRVLGKVQIQLSLPQPQIVGSAFDWAEPGCGAHVLKLAN